MKTRIPAIYALCALILLPCLALPAWGAQDVGKVVALRGKATIERGSSSFPARVRTGLQGTDTIKTGANSRAKLLFIDDSVLTLSANSNLAIKEFVKEKGKQGKSVFNLLDGKMRSVVGKTRFEVRTPTAVAAARGTVIYFDVGMANNQSFSKIICLEGTVEVRSVIPTVTGTSLLTPGTMVIVKTGDTTLPPPAPAPQSELNQINNSNGNNGGDNSGGTGGGGGYEDENSSNTCPPNCGTEKPVVIEQRPILPSKVKVTVPIPQSPAP